MAKDIHKCGQINIVEKMFYSSCFDDNMFQSFSSRLKYYFFILKLAKRILILLPSKNLYIFIYETSSFIGRPFNDNEHVQNILLLYRFS